MRLVSLLILLSSAAWSQKIEARATTGTRDDSALGWKAPQSVYASRPGSPFTGQNWIMTDTDCAGTASATPTACRWSGSTWQATGGSGAGAAAVCTPVAASTTPAFPVSTSSPQTFSFPATACGTFSTNWGGNATASMTTTSATAGQQLIFYIKQDHTTPRTFTWPGSVQLTCNVDPVIDHLTIVAFLWDGTIGTGMTCSYPNQTTLSLPEGALTACGTAGTGGRMCAVSDLTTPALGSTAAGSGAVHGIVFDNGTNWIVMSATGVGGSGSSAWSAITNPSGNLSLAMSTNLTSFTASGNTSTNDLWAFLDTTGNTGTGHLFNIHSVGSSTVKPVVVTAQGTANGVEMDNTGLLQKIGTGSIKADALSSAIAVTNPTINASSSLGTSTGSGMYIPGSSLTAGSIYYQASGGLTLAKADAAGTLPAVCLAITTTACAFAGVYRFSGSQSWTAGNIIYVSAASAGALVTTAPSTSGQFVQRVGIALANDTILIRPSIDVGGVQ